MGLSNIPVNRIVRKPLDQAPPDTRKSDSTFGALLLTFIVVTGHNIDFYRLNRIVYTYINQ